jgi:predicted secreted protein
MLFSSTAGAAGDPAPLTYDRISLSVSAEKEVQADLLVATMTAQREGEDASELARAVNTLIDWALTQAQAQTQVQSQTLGYESSPVYSKGNMTGWRVRQSILLRSRDAAALSGLVGGLQERLLLQSMSYRVSDARREEAEEALIRSGIDAFNRRAGLIAKQMGKPLHRLVEMRVETQGDHPAPVFRTMAAMPAADAAPAPPRIEAGKQAVRVSVSGVIELKLQ